MSRKPTFKSQDTFKDEFDFLQNHVPHALEFQSEQRLGNVLQNEFGNYLNLDNLQVEPLPDDFDTYLFGGLVELDFMSENSERNTVNSLLYYASSSNVYSELVQNLFLHFGHHAFGRYLPMHRFYKNPHNGWGMYFFPEVIGPHVDDLYKTFHRKISRKDLLDLFIWCVYRHELFHFHTEYFATTHEVSQKKAYYLPYFDKIYRTYAGSEDWLEEALAEASVLESRLVGRRTKIPAKLRKDIYEYDLKRMPDGYKHYECTKYINPKIAHRVLATQVLHPHMPKPVIKKISDIDRYSLITKDHTIRREFIQKDIKVPAYMVTGFRNITRPDSITESIRDEVMNAW